MTISLPSGWGPATLLLVLGSLALGIGGLVELWQGDMTYTEYADSMKYAFGGLGALAIGRGAAYIGGDPGFAKGAAANSEGGEQAKWNFTISDVALVVIAASLVVAVIFGFDI